ncbi:hypothetical protein MA16_Dca003235 [Dendrobium catenatum]|uniref:Uncharacterized protein n=1 Tax=Dendrobium catenatum TaxID=906689 RepID=A0A2I0XC56_9ASPA|nr:hypothetical protein MA16_Dca003235 [Dendrobium catenatum]
MLETCDINPDQAPIRDFKRRTKLSFVHWMFTSITPTEALFFPFLLSIWPDLHTRLLSTLLAASDLLSPHPVSQGRNPILNPEPPPVALPDPVDLLSVPTPHTNRIYLIHRRAPSFDQAPSTSLPYPPPTSPLCRAQNPKSPLVRPPSLDDIPLLSD